MNKVINKIKSYGEWAAITGASSGIGKEFAIQLASMGANLVLVARRENLLEKLSSKIITDYDVKVIIICGDLTNDSTIIELKEKTKNIEVAILINNAGFGFIGEYGDGTIDNYKNMINLNCIVPTELTYHFLDGMKKRKRGAVIFLGSTFSFLPAPYASLYSATKSFNSSLGSTLWKEMKEYNIDILSLNPGGTRTEFDRISKDNLFTRNPEDVVKTAFTYLGKQPSIIDGRYNKLMVLITRILPIKFIVDKVGNFISNNLRKVK